jgi:hypothetical protein
MFNEVPFSTPFFGPTAATCNQCHKLDTTFNAELGVRFPGLFGSDGNTTFVLQPQLLKNPHFRNQYQKVGMFGNALTPQVVIPGNNEHQGDQVRGFGFLHDGSVDTDFRFMNALFFAQLPFNPAGIPFGPAGDAIRRDFESLLLAFPSNLAPIVGQQVTLTASTAAAAGPRVDLLEWAASVGQCDLVVKGWLAGREQGFLYTNAGYQADRAGVPLISPASLRQLASFVGATYTCAPPGSGRRIGIDRDLDGILDGDEH